MSAAKYNFTIEQGVDFSRQMAFTDANGAPVDLTGDTWRGTIRSAFGASPAFIFTFDTTQAASGIIIYSMADTVTSTLPSTLGTDPLVYDIERIKSGTALVSRILQGKIKVSPEVTT